MEYRKTLIGAASILALSVGMGDVAGAAASKSQTDAKQSLGRDLTSASVSDPLLALISATQGTFTEEAVHSALTEMYRNANPAQLQGLPELLSNIATLGVGQRVYEVSQQTLIDIVSSAADIDEMARQNIVAQLQADGGNIRLAQQDEILRRRGRRDPNEVGQTTGRDPTVVGQVGGGGY